MTTTYFKNWDESHSQLFGRHPIKIGHRLLESGLFREERLASVIDGLPSSHYNLNSMGTDYKDPQWREGYLATASGKEVIDAIKRGRVWLNIRRIQDVDKSYADLLAGIMEELEDKVPGLRTFKHDMGVLISSPKVRIFYHSDVPGQSLWQIAGRKRLYVYPNFEPFLRPQDVEKIVLGLTEEEVPYRPWFDEHAQVYDLEPGEMASWPLNGPHQVFNEDCLNISVTTSHWTPEIRNSYAVHYANGVLRNVFGYRPRVTKPVGLQVYPKAALALAWKKLNLASAEKLVRQIEFKIDPQSPAGISDVAVPFAK